MVNNNWILVWFRPDMLRFCVATGPSCEILDRSSQSSLVWEVRFWVSLGVFGHVEICNLRSAHDEANSITHTQKLF